MPTLGGKRQKRVHDVLHAKFEKKAEGTYQALLRRALRQQVRAQLPELPGIDVVSVGESGGAAEAFYRACDFYVSEKMVMLGKYL